MGFLDNVKSRFKNNDEEEFERAFHEGAWPEGVDDFEPMTNTGSFLPATYDVDPLADASLPGNAMNAAAHAAEGAANPSVNMPGDEGAGTVTESVVRAAATSIYAVPTAPSPFQVIDGSLKPRNSEPDPAVQQPGFWDAADDDLPMEEPAEDRPSGYSAGTPRYDMGDDNVQVFSRPAGEQRAARPAATPRAEQKPFADRLRERVAAANVSGQADETLGRSKAGMQPVPPAAVRSTRRSEHASDAELDAELEERRRSRRANSRARSERVARADAELRERRYPEGFEPGASDRRARPERREDPQPADGAGPSGAVSPAAAPSGPRPVPVSCTVVRPRSYDDVRDIAQGAVGEHRPVVLVMRGCSNDLARRVLDFSFGLCCASGAGMKELGDHVYVVLPRGTALTDDDRASLRRQGVLLRG